MENQSHSSSTGARATTGEAAATAAAGESSGGEAQISVERVVGSLLDLGYIRKNGAKYLGKLLSCVRLSVLNKLIWLACFHAGIPYERAKEQGRVLAYLVEQLGPDIKQKSHHRHPITGVNMNHVVVGIEITDEGQRWLEIFYPPPAAAAAKDTATAMRPRPSASGASAHGAAARTASSSGTSALEQLQLQKMKEEQAGQALLDAWLAHQGEEEETAQLLMDAIVRFDQEQEGSAVRKRFVSFLPLVDNKDTFVAAVTMYVKSLGKK